MGSAASAVSSGLQLGGGIYNIIEGGKQKRAAAGALGAYDRQDLTNIANGLTVSRLGADLQREDQSRLAASQVDALRGAGTRGLIGGLGRVETGNQLVGQRIAADLDQQQKNIDMTRAEDQARIRSMQEARENADIAALSSQYQAGRQQMMQGIGNVIQAGGSAANAFGGGTGAASMAARPDLSQSATNASSLMMPAQNTRIDAPYASYGNQGMMFAPSGYPQSNYYPIQ